MEHNNSIRLIVGLGNTGAEYEDTRHNAGFWYVDAVARQTGARFSSERKFHGEVARARVGGQRVMAAETQHLRQSIGAGGRRAGALLQDSADANPGRARRARPAAGAIKLKLGGGTAGHNGLKDTQARLSTPDFWRLRIGIGHPRTLQLEQDVGDFVLHPPRKDEQPRSIKRSSAARELSTYWSTANSRRRC